MEWQPPTGDSALYRARFPKSWRWTTDTEMLSHILYALLGANWQRAGGDESKRPTPITRPLEDRDIVTAEPDPNTYSLAEIRGELARRRAELAKK